jgi:hypothetical protein
VARNARRSLGPGRRGAVLVDRLERELEAADEVLAQTELRLKGKRPIPDRRVHTGCRRPSAPAADRRRSIAESTQPRGAQAGDVVGRTYRAISHRL